MSNGSTKSVKVRLASRKLQLGVAGCIAIALAPAASAAPLLQSLQSNSFVRFTPSVEARIEYDDNIFRTENDEKSDVVTRITPALDVEIGLGGANSGLNLSYRPEFGIFSSSQDDDIINHDFSGSYRYAGEHLTGAVRGSYVIAHDPRGQGVTDGFGDSTTDAVDEPPRYRRESWGLSLGNIERGARTRILFDYQHDDLQYETFRLITRPRDHKTDAYEVELGYEIGAKTYAIVGTSLRKMDYDFTPLGQPNLDSDEWRHDAGVVWDATAKLTGRVTVGWQQKEYDVSALGEDSGLTWDVDVTWDPNSYTSFDVLARRGYRETNFQGSAIATANYGVRMTQDWNDRVSSNVSLSYQNDDYDNDPREDDTVATSIGLDYNFRRWLTLGAGYELSVRDSTVLNADFTRNLVFVSARMGL